MECVLPLIFGIIGATVCAMVAGNKGRNPLGWGVLGFFFPLIGIIIVCVISNLNDERAKELAIENENRRLREQLRQERIKLESLREHTSARLDAHDRQLGVDTRTMGALGPGESSEDLPLAALEAGAQDNPEIWYYDSGSGTVGPLSAKEMHRRLAMRTISPDTVVWAEHLRGWTPMRDVPEFAEATQ